MLYYLFTDWGKLESKTQQQHSSQKLERKSLEELRMTIISMKTGQKLYKKNRFKISAEENM